MTFQYKALRTALCNRKCCVEVNSHLLCQGRSAGRSAGRSSLLSLQLHTAGRFGLPHNVQDFSTKQQQKVREVSACAG